MLRVVLFLVTNLAVVALLSVVLSLSGLEHDAGFVALLLMSAFVGFGGAFVSLLLSKRIAKWSTGARVLTDADGPEAAWILDTVRDLAARAKIGVPEVALYEGPPNAFATGAFRDNSLVAVSTGLLALLERDEVEAVLGHEVAHVANGDMVTLALIQGVVNTFVVLLSRVVGTVVDTVVFKQKRGRGIGYFLTVIVCEIVFGILASLIVAWFSRRREYRADADAARLLGSPRSMVGALRRLGGASLAPLPASLAASGIAGKRGVLALFSTHPPLEDRLARLQAGEAVTPTAR